MSSLSILIAILAVGLFFIILACVIGRLRKRPGWRRKCCIGYLGPERRKQKRNAKSRPECQADTEIDSVKIVPTKRSK